MKSVNWLFYLVAVFVTGILISFTGYTTTTPSKKWNTDKVTETAKATSTTVKKTPCGCCAKRYELQQERIKRSRARKSTQEMSAKTSAP